ncbi:MAG: hypothetical protein HYY25_04540 [Candidatus Wallbacteria bacterium]|nr:hypothetical protein [Candidatus Wallbacteria bacterium]
MSEFAISGDTWEWDGTAWTERWPPLSPPARKLHAMANDAARRKTVLFGGVAVFESQARLDETREWDGAIWTLRAPRTSPPPLQAHAMVYDTVRSETLRFGGDDDSGGQRG